jgi:hypothetical protein
MPFLFDAGSNTQLTLIVADIPGPNQQYELVWPSKPPQTHGVLSVDPAGNLSWLPQLVSGMLGDPDNSYYASGVVPPASGGSTSATVALTLDRQMLFKSYTSPNVIAFEAKLRCYMDRTSAGSTDIAALKATGVIVNNPQATSLSQIWTLAAPLSVFGEISSMLTDLQLLLTRDRNNACSPSFIVVGQPGVRVNADISMFPPSNAAVQANKQFV